MFQSIRWRLIFSYVILAVITVSTVGLIGMWVAQRTVEEKEERYLRVNAETIADQALPLLSPKVSSNEITQLVKAAAFFGNVRVRILDLQGDLLVDSGLPDDSDGYAWFTIPPGVGDTLSFPSLESWFLNLQNLNPFFLGDLREFSLPAQELLPPGISLTIVRKESRAWGDILYFETLQQLDEYMDANQKAPVEEQVQASARTVTVPIGKSDRIVGYVELSSGVDYGAEALATARQAFVLAGFGAVALAIILGLLMGRRLSAPLTNLAETTARMSAGDLSVRAGVKGKDEIGELASQFNKMAQQLETSFAQLESERDTLRRFIADASHELRTPITALSNFNELLQGAAVQDPGARAEFLTESESQIKRLAWITDNLLNLSRLDGGIALLDLNDNDVGEIVTGLIPAFEKRAEETGIKLEHSISEAPHIVRCDRARLEIAIVNLVDNAFKFTPFGGHVKIGVESSQKGVRIWVQDTGEGIHPEDMPHIFERFYRGRHNQRDGSGLGLSIVQSIIQAHAGDIHVESEPGSGTTVSIVLPYSQA